MGRTLTGGFQLPLPPPSAAVRTRFRGDLFTAADLAAAELLVHLSESSGEVASSPASSSSPRSVNMQPPPPLSQPPPSPEAVVVGNEEEEEMGPWQRTKRYRLMADLYTATRPVGGGGGEEKPRPRRP